MLGTFGTFNVVWKSFIMKAKTEHILMSHSSWILMSASTSPRWQIWKHWQNWRALYNTSIEEHHTIKVDITNYADSIYTSYTWWISWGRGYTYKRFHLGWWQARGSSCNLCPQLKKFLGAQYRSNRVGVYVLFKPEEKDKN